MSCGRCRFDALQELSGLYRRLREAKQQVIGLQNEQVAGNSERAQAMAADLASAQEVSCVP